MLEWQTEKYERMGGAHDAPASALLLQEIYDKGLLFMVNQAVLHHYGLALGVSVEEGVVVGLNVHKTSDPEGIWFDEDTLRMGRAKMRDAGLLGPGTPDA